MNTCNFNRESPLPFFFRMWLQNEVCMLLAAPFSKKGIRKQCAPIIFLATLMINHKVQAQFTVPQITTTESTCQANGTVTVKGNVTYLNFLTGGNIPGQIGPKSGSELDVVFSSLAPANYTLTVINPQDNEERKYPVTVTGNYEQNWSFTASTIFTPCSAGTPTVSIGNLTITGATSTQQRPDFFFRISTKGGSLPSDGTEPPTYNTPLNGSFPIPYPSGTGGNYEIQGRDACGNYKTINVSVPSSAPTPTVTSAFQKFINCAGDAEYKVTASGGTAPYIFKVKSGPDQVNNQVTDPASTTYTLKAGGTYVINVMDQCGGMRDVTITPKAYVSPTTTVSTSIGACDPQGGNGTGSIRLVTVADGIGPFTYSIVSAACGINRTVVSTKTDTTFTNLPRPCTYTVTITDGCNKSSTLTVSLTGPGAEAMACNKSIQCPSGASENYRLTMSVAVRPPYNPTPNYTFVIKDSTTNTNVYSVTQSSASYTSSGLVPGKYYISITDACGATCTDSVVITKYQNPTVSVDVNNRCFGQGQANVIGVNNRGPENGWNNIYTYKIIAPSASRINAGPEVDSPPKVGQFSSLVSGGTYTFSFYDGCKTVTTSVEIPNYTQPTWEVGFGALCPPKTVADLKIINLQPAGQIVGPYKWRIISTDSDKYASTAPYNGTLPYPNSMGQEDSVFTNLPAKGVNNDVATYNILGNDGCKNSYQGSGKIGALPDATLILNTISVCPDGSTTLKARVSIPVVGATYRYYRDGIKVAESDKLFTVISPALPGSYTVKVIASILPDSSCSKTSPAVVVTAAGQIKKTIPTQVCPGEVLNLSQITTGSSVGTVTLYSDKDFTQAIANPSNITQEPLTRKYYIKLVTTGPPICTLLDSIEIAPKQCCVKPTAGSDIEICQTVATVDLPDANSSNQESWKAWIGNPATTQIDSLTGLVTELIAVPAGNRA